MVELAREIDKLAVANFIRWVCRILGSLAGLLVIFIFVGHLFTPDEQTTGYVFTMRDYLMFTGLGLMVAGMLVGWFNELWAFIVTTAGFLLFNLTNLVSSGFFPVNTLLLVFLIIGFGYLVVWLIERKTNEERG
ncbi:MAG TPA: hypothetical protein PKV16_07095 [Caldisericia bacterium]|nr:hypothetical protein [Caldisericia bacterium]HPF49534.1 hypothetical protein [Caldisericia bacterium]HPI84172.1 hypothetical protein [Caldisericia bacterium]HPQ93533.1 hypothetical protein [Caldisericia bacterium]HRV75461.1 hypothetical protein [Caldisericia bacterium]